MIGSGISLIAEEFNKKKVNNFLFDREYRNHLNIQMEIKASIRW